MEKSDIMLLALMELTEYGVSVDLQETLLYGSIQLGVKPGALQAILDVAVASVMENNVDKARAWDAAQISYQKGASNLKD